MVMRENAVEKLIGGITFLVGLLLLGLGIWFGNRQYTQLKTWPEVDALVTSSRITEGKNDEDETIYGTEFKFRYTVNGKQYDTPAASSYKSSNDAEMKGKVDAYAPGTHHPIRYNPTDPTDIRFDAGYNFESFFLPFVLGGLGLMLSVFGTGWLARSPSARARLCPSCGQRVEKGRNTCPRCQASLPYDASAS